jgi:hypothetical protein
LQVGQQWHSARTDFSNGVGNFQTAFRFGDHDPPQANNFLRADTRKGFDFERRADERFALAAKIFRISSGE